MPLPNAKKPWLFYRLGPTKEKELFKRQRNTYDGVVVPAHIASYYSAFCSEFIGSLGKPYFIDPMTYIFANDPEQIKRFVKDSKTGRTAKDRYGKKKKGDVKRSYSKLIEKYGSVVQRAVEQNRPVEPTDFRDQSATKQFVKQILDFQRNRLASLPDKYRKYEKYAQKGGKPLTISENLPMCIVPPYFPTRTLNARGWHPTNIKLIQETKTEEPKIPVFAVILAGTDTLAAHVKQIASDYSSAGADGFLLWPDGFRSDQDSTTLRKVFEAIQVLENTGKPTILMYGDAFSLALYYGGIAGFACGICYGEWKLSTKDIDIEGTIPPLYYLQRLKKKVRIETEARRIPINQYADLVCNCDICQRKTDPSTLDDTEAREHFMLVRAEEIRELRNGLSQRVFTGMLREGYQKYDRDPVLGPLGYLQNWVDVLSKSGG